MSDPAPVPPPGPDADELLAVAIAVAREAGAVLMEHFAGTRRVVATKSSTSDVVTEADLAAEATIRSSLTRLRPDDGVLGEEGEELPGSSGLRWVVDPLDGTVGFAYGIPHWCVSVACEDRHGVVCGVVHDPVKAETFAARRGGGAWLEGEAEDGSGGRSVLSGSDCEELSMALVATGFGYDREQRARQAEVTGPLLSEVRDIRRLGSAALDLAWVAAGRYDAYFEHGLKPWDAAAGTLICREAGLAVEEIGDGPSPSAGALPGGVLAAPAPLAPQLRALVEPSALP